MARITGGQAVVEGLKQQGVEFVFGLAGDHCLAIYDALYDTPEIRQITVRHEQTAAFMADGYARISGRPGVCVTTTGPGAFNTLTAIQTALSDCSPVLQIMSQVDSRLVGRHTGAIHEAKDQPGIFERVTNWNATVSNVGEIVPAIQTAFRVMRTERPGPTAIEVFADVLQRAEEVEVPEKVSYVPPQGDWTAVDQAVELLLASTQPVIWAGGGAAMADAAAEVRELAELLQAPVFTSGAGKGVLPEDHPLSLGVSSTNPGCRALIAAADGALAVGIRLNQRVIGTQLSLPSRLVQIDIDPSAIGRTHPVEISIVGDAKKVLSQILQRIRAHGEPSRPSREAEVAELRRGIESRLWTIAPAEMRLLGDIRDVLDRSAIVVADMTMIGGWARGGIKAFGPRTFHYPHILGTLGFGFPAGLGAKVAAPDRQVVVLSGDGGFLFAGADLATAVQHGINVVTVIFNDNTYGMLKVIQAERYGGRHIGVDLLNPDFVKLAESFGAVGLRVDGPENLGKALREALTMNRPVVIELPIAVRDPRR